MKSALALVLLLSYVIYIHAQSGTVAVTSSATFDSAISSNTNYLWYCGFGSYPTCDSSNQVYSCPTQTCASRQIRWGSGTNGVPSGCGYSGLSGSTVTFNGVKNVFACGYLTHYNNPVSSGTGASSFNVNLAVSMTGAFSFSQSFTFQIDIDETPNQSPCVYPSDTPCADKLSFDTTIGVVNPQTFIVSNNVYTVTMLGFRESLTDTSAPAPFISQENLSTTKVLVAQVLQCPAVCTGGAAQYKVVTNADGSVSCVCDCTGVRCTSPKTISSSCSCDCPASSCNGGQVTDNCGCSSCTGVSCTGNFVPDPTNHCICGCPSLSCNGGAVARNNSGCYCDCSPLGTCPGGSNYVRDSNCNCQCNTAAVQAQCAAAGKVFNANTCSCVCGTSCGTGFTQNPQTCSCDCDVTCNNAPVTDQCTCGPCNNKWTGSNCDQCSLTEADCKAQGQNLIVDNTQCACVCAAGITCSGATPIFVPPCSCRACQSLAECCGNGVFDSAYEQCDNSAPSNGQWDSQCCTAQCTLSTSSCSDGNGCTTGDTCANGFCSGNPVICTDSLCATGACDPNSGTCVNTSRTDGSTCGTDSAEGICTRKCVAGNCVDQPGITCSAPTLSNGLPDQCNTAVCGVLPDGTAGCVKSSVPDGTSCNDASACTINDVCTAGVCAGTAKCPVSTNPCSVISCQGDGTCLELALPNARTVPCDDADPCTTGDHCTSEATCVGGSATCGSDDICYNVTCKPSDDSKSASCVYDVATDLACDIYTTSKDGVPTVDACRIGKCRVDPKSSVGKGICLDVGKNKDCKESGGGSQSKDATIGMAVGGAGAVGIAGGAAAFIARRIRKKRLLDPESWAPASLDMGSSNPLYNQKKEETFNELYEVKSH